MTTDDLDIGLSEPDDSDSTPTRRRRAVKVLVIAIAVLVGLALVAGLALAAWLNSSLSNVTRFDADVPEDVRIAESADDGLNIVLLGTDTGESRGNRAIMDAVSDDPWPAGTYRSDATMLLHIPEDRDAAYFVSMPRDSYVPLYDAAGAPAGDNKINAALSLYGPTGAMLTIEQLSGLRMDHVAIVDWDGFADITDAVGGVAVTIAGEGRVELDGEGALDYVRERYDLPGGDFDRVRRQQNFIRAMTRSVLSRDVVANPRRLKTTLDAVTAHLAVDDDFSNGDIRSLAWSLRGLDSDDLHFITLPHSGTDNVSGAGSIVVVDEPAAEELFASLREGTIEEWLARNPDTQLDGRVD